ncbi:coatomer subunit epsilon-2-like [Phragmites australis]|uniref:coatomer subunit epsilon-2-like n=1 Tax=Phragmites australis TaxID=29695 RepID=UPI002D769E5E|nr:coatomer subunit epsilon-2-like [Phragmites australis]
MASPDHLFGLRNSFYIGAYHAAITSSQSVPAHALSPDELVERDALLYRSYIAIGSHQLVIDEIGPSAATPLQAVKLLAVYLSGDAGNKESVISRLHELLGDAAVGSNPILRLMAGTVFLHERDYAEALKHTNSGGNMELLALNVQIYLQMHRADHAEKQIRVMQQLDEDHTLAQLANAWVDLAMGGSKIQEAHLIFQDLSEKYPTTCMILNGKALCSMHRGNFEEAEGLLLESLNKDAKDAETLANLTVCSLNLGKPATRYLSQLKLAHPDHMLVKRMSSAEDSFDRTCQAMA